MTGAAILVRRVSLIKSYVIVTSIFYISTLRTSLIMWKVFVHQAGYPICSTRQAVRHSHFNLLDKLGSRIWVKFRKLEFFYHKHD